MSLKSALSKAKGIWKKGVASKPSFESDIEDGKYVVKVTKAELGESESSGRLQVAWEAVVTVGDSKGKKLRWYDGLVTENNIMWFSRALAKLGFEAPEDPNDLPEVLEEVEKKKPVVRVTVKTSEEGFQNVRINKKAEDGGDDDDLGTTTDDKEPGEVEDEDKDKKKKAAEDDGEGEVEEKKKKKEVSEDDGGDDTPAIEVGLKVEFTWKGDDLVGEVIEVLKKEERVRVEVDDTVYKLKLESIRPAPKTKVSKK